MKTEELIALYQARKSSCDHAYGAHNSLVEKVSKDLGYQLYFWNVDTLDWKESHRPDGWVSHGLAQFNGRDNTIVLNHDIHESTADHLDLFISEIIALGPTRFEIVAGG